MPVPAKLKTMAQHIVNFTEPQKVRAEIIWRDHAPLLAQQSPKEGKKEGVMSVHRVVISRNVSRNNLPTSLQWTDFEHPPRALGPYWFLYVGGFATLLIIFGIISHSYLFIAFVVIAFITLGIYLKTPPRELTYILAQDGIYAGGKRYEYGALKSFWVFDSLNPPELSLETKAFLTPFVRLPLGGTNPQDVRAALGHSLPEKQHEDTLIDQLARIIGF